MILDIQDLKYLSQVTDSLNELPDAPEGSHLQVQLVDDYTQDQVLARWMDDNGYDWYLVTDPDRDKDKQPG